MTDTVIEYKDISKSYDEKVLMNNFNMKIEKGEFIVIIGSSGCGKTTLLKMINGLITPDKGSVLVNGKDISNEDMIKVRRKIGYCIQGSMLFPHMNVYDNIAYVPTISGTDEETIDKAVHETLKLVNLDDEYLKHLPNELSGGQAQRVGIARALASSPEILLMDEPFGAIDAITRAQLQKNIKEIHKETGITIIFITHDISEALKLGDKILILSEGNVEQYDTPDNIIKNPKTQFVRDLLKDALIDHD